MPKTGKCDSWLEKMTQLKQPQYSRNDGISRQGLNQLLQLHSCIKIKA